MFLMLDQRRRVSSGRCLRKNARTVPNDGGMLLHLDCKSGCLGFSSSTLTVYVVVNFALVWALWEVVKAGWNPYMQGCTGEQQRSFGKHCMHAAGLARHKNAL